MEITHHFEVSYRTSSRAGQSRRTGGKKEKEKKGEETTKNRVAGLRWDPKTPNSEALMIKKENLERE